MSEAEAKGLPSTVPEIGTLFTSEQQDLLVEAYERADLVGEIDDRSTFYLVSTGSNHLFAIIADVTGIHANCIELARKPYPPILEILTKTVLDREFDTTHFKQFPEEGSYYRIPPETINIVKYHFSKKCEEKDMKVTYLKDRNNSQ